jgi:ubiquinone/menaquinone biosynthesis C-methylase UbiE
MEEMARLELQDKMITTGMDGVLPELPDPTLLRRVLDVGCGTGGWLIETAKTYPTIERLVGADISGKILAYAREAVTAQHLDGRVEFKTMDAVRVLEFPAGSFDLVNQRLGASWLRTWEWRKILLEYQRVIRAGGIIRITECAVVESNSPALTELCDLVTQTCYRSGRFSAPCRDGIIRGLVPLMTQHGIENVQTREYILVYRVGTAEHQSFAQDMAHVYHVSLPFLHKWTRVPSNYEEIYQQALKEMQMPEFVATWTFVTAWGTKSCSGGPLLMRGLR